MTDLSFEELCKNIVVENSARYGELQEAEKVKAEKAKETKRKHGGKVIIAEAQEIVTAAQAEIKDYEEDFFLSDDFYNLTLQGFGVAMDGEYIMNEIKRRIKMGMKIKRNPNLDCIF